MKKILAIMGLIACVLGCKGTEQVEEGVDVFKTQTGKTVKLYCIKHGSVRMQIEDKWFYIDPVTEAAKPSTDYTVLPKADYIFVTHEHGDHLDAAAIEQLSKDGTRVFGNPATIAKLGFGETMSLDQTVNLDGGVFVCAVPAYNTSEDKLNFHPKGRDFGYVFGLDGFHVYFAGDTEVIPEMSELADVVDVAFLPCNLPYTMTPEQVNEAARIIKPSVLFPYHYGQTEIQKVADLLSDTSIDVRIREYQ